MEEESQQSKENGGGLKSLLFKTIPYLLVLVLGVAAGIYGTQQKPEIFGLSKGAVAAQAEVDALVAQVGKIIALPTDEKPTVATVTDASKVKDQPFFAKAQNGDKVLIYQKAQKAILYRPSSNIIVEVGAVNINNQPTTTAEPSPTPTSKSKVVSTPQASSTPSATPAQ